MAKDNCVCRTELEEFAVELLKAVELILTPEEITNLIIYIQGFANELKMERVIDQLDSMLENSKY